MPYGQYLLTFSVKDGFKGEERMFTLRMGVGGHACVSFHEEINTVREGFNNQIKYCLKQVKIELYFVSCVSCFYIPDFLSLSLTVTVTTPYITYSGHRYKQ